MRRLLWGLLTIFAAVVPSTFSWAQETEEVIVREIEVLFSGPETVNRSVVMANIQTAVGKPRSREMIEQDVRNLINTGYFYDVRVLEEPMVDGVRIVFQVQGKATIKEIIMEGNKRFKGERVFIKQIKFTGNKAFLDARLLKIMKTRRHWWGSWLAGTGVLKEEDFKEDLDKLRD